MARVRFMAIRVEETQTADFIEVMARAFQYQEMIPVFIPDVGTSLEPNSVTKETFVKAKIQEMVRAIYTQQKINETVVKTPELSLDAS